MTLSKQTKRWPVRCTVITVVTASTLAYMLPLHADTANYATVTQSTAGVLQAVNSFIATLSAAQTSTPQTACTMSGGGTLSYSYLVGLVECWSNLPGSRNGLQMAGLSTAQQTAALNIMGSALSTRGAQLIKEIRASDDVIDASTTNSPWGAAKYSIALYGTPSTTSPWQLQFSGHHLAMNLNYNGTYVSATPLFAGTEPPNWTDTSGTAHAPLDIQRAALYTLAEALQADSAVASSARLSGTYDDVIMGINAGTGCDSNFPQSYPSSARGVSVGNLSTAQKTLVKQAILAWTSLLPKATSNVLSAAYTSDTALANTYVGYAVGDSGKADFSPKPSGLTTQRSYIRIDGPRVWIEFIVQQGVAYRTQVHYHALWRDKVADYGGTFTTASAGTTGLCGAATSNGGGGTAPTGTPPTGTPPTGTPPAF
jgi:Protein of unknown function (DUF3500)